MPTTDRDFPPLSRLSTGTRTESVAHAIRTAIMSGEMAPGQRLPEADLAAQLGTSNGPVREALRQLEAEGLVVKTPYRGAFVAEVSEREIEDVLIPVRLIIERYAFQRAAHALTEDDLLALGEIVDRMRQAAASGDDATVAELDVAFHELVIQRAAPNQCRQLWRVIQPRVRSYFIRETPENVDLNAVIDLHRELLDALGSEDLDVIAAAVESHIREHPGSPGGVVV